MADWTAPFQIVKIEVEKELRESGSGGFHLRFYATPGGRENRRGGRSNETLANDLHRALRTCLRIPEHLGIQSGNLGTRTDALGQGRERSDRVSGGVGSGLRFEAFAFAA